MGKTSNPKPRMAYAIEQEYKEYLEAWANEEGRSVANLVERILLDAIARKKQQGTPVGAIGTNINESDRKT